MSSPYRTTTDRRSALLSRATYAAGALTAGVAVVTGLLITKVAQSQAATTSKSTGTGSIAQNDNGFSQPGDDFGQGGFVGGGQGQGSAGGSNGS